MCVCVWWKPTFFFFTVQHGITKIEPVTLKLIIHILSFEVEDDPFVLQTNCVILN